MIPLVAAAQVSDVPVGPQQASPGVETAKAQCPPNRVGEIVVCKSTPAVNSPQYGPADPAPNTLPGYALHFRIGNVSADGHSFTNIRGTIADGINFTVPF